MLISDGLRVVEQWLCVNRYDGVFAFVVAAVGTAALYFAARGVRATVRG